jgi:cytosine/uracil/thiamine/allantoin permease
MCDLHRTDTDATRRWKRLVYFTSKCVLLGPCFHIRHPLPGNAVAGGIDLAGVFPWYIDIRRAAIIKFTIAWINLPWQLINKAS